MNDLRKHLPYSHQEIDGSDIEAVCNVLRSEWLTTGPMVNRFEEAFASCVGARFAVAVNNGTSALHAAMYAVGVGPGDEVIVPAMTFAASSNAALYLGAKPLFADVLPDNLLLDPSSVARLCSDKTKLIVAVDYAGHPCDYDSLQAVARGIPILADACHALGATYRGRRVGSLGVLNTFSFHPVKPITTGEGGMVTTDSEDLAVAMRTFRNHGITRDARQRESAGTFEYDMVELGYNYRLSDINCALGLSQLERLASFTEARQRLAERYRELLEGSALRPLALQSDSTHAYHLFVGRLDGSLSARSRDELYAHLRQVGIGANVHYKPVYLHSYYQSLGYKIGLCPEAERAYSEIISLPIFPSMTELEVERVVGSIREFFDR